MNTSDRPGGFLATSRRWKCYFFDIAGACSRMSNRISTRIEGFLEPQDVGAGYLASQGHSRHAEFRQPKVGATVYRLACHDFAEFDLDHAKACADDKEITIAHAERER